MLPSVCLLCYALFFTKKEQKQSLGPQNVNKVEPNLNKVEPNWNKTIQVHVNNMTILKCDLSVHVCHLQVVEHKHILNMLSSIQSKDGKGEMLT